MCKRQNNYLSKSQVQNDKFIMLAIIIVSKIRTNIKEVNNV